MAFHRLCKQGRCPNYAEKGQGFCREHLREHWKRENKVRGVDAIYRSSRWLKIRKIALARDSYLCRECKKPGNTVDHIVPIKHGGNPWDLGNLQTMCAKCHDRKRQQESRRR